MAEKENRSKTSAKRQRLASPERRLVLDMLMQVTEQNKLSHLVLRDALNENGEEINRSFVTRLFSGAIERRIELDYIIGQFSSTPLKKMRPAILEILRMGVYQLKYMDQVPASAAVNEAVKLAKERGMERLGPFVNGVLRNIDRSMETIHYPDPAKEPVRAMSVCYSMPEWIIEHFCACYGQDVAAEILHHIDVPDDRLTIRVNQSVASMDEVASEMRAAGVAIEQDAYYEDVLRISGFDKVESLPSYDRGAFSVQDAGAITPLAIAAPFLKGQAEKWLREGRNDTETFQVLDLCAAPGGKSQQMRDILEVHQREIEETYPYHILSCDIGAKKIEWMKENYRRFGEPQIEARARDALVFEEEESESYDVVLADVPCSGLGVLSAKADLRYNVAPEGLKSLAVLQRDILTSAIDYLKPGGLLIYATCTINPAENEDMVAWLVETQNMTCEEITDELPETIEEEYHYAAQMIPQVQKCLRTSGVQILPGICDMHGSFVSILRKRRAD